MVNKSLLLVEGEFDQSFYKHFCRSHNLDTKVTIFPPKQLGATFNTKQGAINHLPSLLQQLDDGQLNRLAMIVDADSASNGGGFDLTLIQVKNQLIPFGFDPSPQKLQNGGLVFSHSDGLADFGLWIMPNNHSDGILENWIAQSIASSEQTLFDKASSIVSKIQNPKFAEIRRSKAEIATWLAWQDRPGEGLYYAVTGNLLNSQGSHYVGLHQWLIRVFK